MPSVDALPAFSDNYLWLLHAGGEAAVVDPGDATVVREALKAKNLQLTAILLTHHHPDHVGGVAALLADRKVPVYGPAAERGQIPWIDHPLKQGDRVELAPLGLAFDVFEVPGHTLGHIAYHCASERLLFCGDTLFASGCGRLFEGTPQQMYASLSRLAALPPATLAHGAHEYTATNLAFASAVEPARAELQLERGRVAQLRAQGRPSLPTTIAHERRFNPFLRTAEPAVATAASAWAKRELRDEVEIFAALRLWKDGFLT